MNVVDGSVRSPMSGSLDPQSISSHQN